MKRRYLIRDRFFEWVFSSRIESKSWRDLYYEAENEIELPITLALLYATSYFFATAASIGIGLIGVAFELADFDMEEFEKFFKSS